MGPLFSLFAMMILGGMVFVPLFVIAVVILGSALRAFVLAATFTLGAMAGFFTGFMLAGLLMEHHASDGASVVYFYAFAGAASVAGGVIAVFLLGKVAKYPPWRRN